MNGTFQNDSIIDSYEQNPVYTYYDTGIANVKLNITNPDYQTTITAIVKENFIYVKDTTTHVGLKSNKESISIYPNPVDQEMEINVSETFTEYKITIYNICGEVIFKSHNAILTSNKTTIDFKDFTNGIYIIRIEDNDNFYVNKVIKK
ncbi:MAG: T9SS type A sorting domain-containing protein [Bacteroidales bacterium]